MERKYINQSITVATSDITKLSNDICEALECGDIVRKVDSNCKKETYIVAKKESDKMSLVHASSSEIVEVCYEKGANGWVYDETKTPIGGTKLYKHTVDIGGEDFTVICPESSQFNSSNVRPYYIGFNLSNNIHCHLVYSTDAFVLVDGAGSSIATASSITDTVVGL